MRIVKLAAGLAAGYVLGARAGREKYDQITAVAGRLSGRPVTAQAEPEIEGARTDVVAIAAPAVEPPTTAVVPAIEEPTPAVVPRTEESTPAAAGAKPRRPRNRRPKTLADTATTGPANRGTAMSTADLGLDALPDGAAEADVVEQHMPVVDNTEESALTPVPLESDAADVREQRRSV